eukprot:s1543_g12.t1
MHHQISARGSVQPLKQRVVSATVLLRASSLSSCWAMDQASLIPQSFTASLGEEWIDVTFAIGDTAILKEAG